ncbi:histone methyltransferase set2 [Ascosphaera aggregata]|nr:histone methyltransferase set2 [Ascosphaera aggregata]
MSNHDSTELRAQTVADAVTELKLESDESFNPTISIDEIPPTLPDEPLQISSISNLQYDGVFKRPSTPTKMASSASSPRSPATPHRQSRPRTRSATPAEDRAYRSNSGSLTPSNRVLRSQSRSQSRSGTPRTPSTPSSNPSHCSRTSTPRPKQPVRQVPLYSHLPDATEEAKKTFEVLPECTYASKHLGKNEDAMHCECIRDVDPVTGINHACEGDSCVNVATKIECPTDSMCGPDCQNQRFTKHQYADVSVFKTEKKGFGLRANAELHEGDFIYEYIGEVIGEPQFRRRMRQYDQEGIKHFYFMSLEAGVFVDATKKGNLGRFCNHSCNPNCYVDKWIVGDRLRMGIFASTYIQAGEELVFNYNVDRYGADPQPCYCGEPNCTGYIGGKTQTESATKLSTATIEALGIDDFDSWDTAVAKKPRKKKADEGDEEYVDTLQPKELDEKAVNKVMASLVQTKEKWIAVKLLARLQRADDERIIGQIVKMHGYQIMSSQLNLWQEDHNVVLQVLDILEHFPRLTRNKIVDSGIESVIQPLTECGDERVDTKAKALLDAWSTLPVAYRIPRRTAAAAPVTTANPFERREHSVNERDPRRSRSRSPPSRSRSIEPPSGPRNPNKPSRSAGYHHGGRHFRPPFNNKNHNNSNGVPISGLPEGWFTALSEDGRTYYYSETGLTQWHRPTMSGRKKDAAATAAAAAAAAAKSKQKSANDNLQAIIDRITTEKSTPLTKSAMPTTPADMLAGQSQPEKKEKKEKWRQLSEEKQMKIYGNTLYPHIKYVVDKFKHKLPKEELKRLAKELSKKLVSSDYKYKRVEDPTKISDKQVLKVKKYCKEFFDKAVVKHRAYEERRAKRLSSQQPEKNQEGGTPAETNSTANGDNKEGDGDQDVSFQDDIDKTVFSPIANNGGEPIAEEKSVESTYKKRKRDVDGEILNEGEDDDKAGISKKQRWSPTPKSENNLPPPPSPPRAPSSSAQLSPATEEREPRQSSVSEEPASFFQNGDETIEKSIHNGFAIGFESQHGGGKLTTLPEGYMIDQLDHKNLKMHNRPMHGTN